MWSFCSAERIQANAKKRYRVDCYLVVKMSRQIHYNKIKMICLVVEWCWAISIRWELEYDCCVVQRSTGMGQPQKAVLLIFTAQKNLWELESDFPFLPVVPKLFSCFCDVYLGLCTNILFYHFEFAMRCSSLPPHSQPHVTAKPTSLLLYSSSSLGPWPFGLVDMNFLTTNYG